MQGDAASSSTDSYQPGYYYKSDAGSWTYLGRQLTLNVPDQVVYSMVDSLLVGVC